MLETQVGWSADTYGTFASSEYFLNVFVFFLIFAGIILDKMGIKRDSVYFTDMVKCNVQIDAESCYISCRASLLRKKEYHINRASQARL